MFSNWQSMEAASQLNASHSRPILFSAKIIGTFIVNVDDDGRSVSTRLHWTVMQKFDVMLR